jgi:ribosomal protein S18 acetylase RimI-like enzyme
MKKILLLSLLAVSFAVQSAVEIRPYIDGDKAAVMELVFQDPMNFFTGSAIVKKGFMPQNLFESENKKNMEGIFSDSLRKKYVMVENGKVIGFVEFFKTLEPNLETIKEQLEAQGFQFDEKQMLAAMPTIKRTKAESKEFVMIECLVVDKSVRRKGYGKQLMKEVERFAKELWPTLSIIQLNTNTDNDAARKLYQSLGYQVDTTMSQQLALMEIVVYKKTIA